MRFIGGRVRGWGPLQFLVGLTILGSLSIGALAIWVYSHAAQARAVDAAAAPVSSSDAVRHVPRVGYLSGFTPDFPSTSSHPHAERFLTGLRELGYTDQQDVDIEYRFAENDLAKLHDLAVELT